jgi:hypothetical protein
MRQSQLRNESEDSGAEDSASPKEKPFQEDQVHCDKVKPASVETDLQ